MQNCTHIVFKKIKACSRSQAVLKCVLLRVLETKYSDTGLRLIKLAHIFCGSFSGWLGCDLDVREILVRHPAREIHFSLLQSVQTGSRTLPAYSTCVGASSQLRQSGRSVKLTTHQIQSRSNECEWLYLHAPVCLHGVNTSHFTFASILKTTARHLKRKTMDYETKKYWAVNFFFGLRFQFTENAI